MPLYALLYDFATLCQNLIIIVLLCPGRWSRQGAGGTSPAARLMIAWAIPRAAHHEHCIGMGWRDIVMKIVLSSCRGLARHGLRWTRLGDYAVPARGRHATP